jgi:phage-related tail fiber protein
MSMIKTPYFAILTTIGMSKLAKAVAQNTTVSLTHLAVGDGEGPEGIPIPFPDQKQLIHECRRAPINTLAIDPNSGHQIIAEQIIPASEGGWWVRELGLYDEDGDLCAVANCAPSYKPKLEEGSGREMVLRMILALSNTKAVKLLILVSC